MVTAAVLDDVTSGDFDMIVLPGGMPGVKHLRADARAKELLARHTQENRHTAAISGAPSVLAPYGHLYGKKPTGNPKFKGRATIKEGGCFEDTVVTDGNFVTSRGAGSAITSGLALVETPTGTHRRDEVKAGLPPPR